MKKLLFLFMAVLACNYVIAQQKVYCEIVGTQKFAKSQVTVGIDFGQLVGDDGKPLSFNSMVDAMNYMGSLGWEFEQAYVVTMPGMGGGQNVYHWLLSKYIGENESGTNGFKTRGQYETETDPCMQ